MNKKIKVIELYQKLAKQENMPDKIKYNNDIYYLCIDSLENVFYYETNKGFQLMTIINSVQALNREVEILDDEEEIDIKMCEPEWFEQHRLEMNEVECDLAMKINEIINYLLKLDKKINKENKNA